MKRGSSGFSLLELTVVLLIFALVSTISIQALQVTLRGKTRLEANAEGNADLARALTLMRHDLEAAQPLAFTARDGVERPALVIETGGRGFDLTLGGQPVLSGDGDSPGLHRVEWRLDPVSRQLTRRVWLSVIPSNSARPGPAVVLLDDIETLQVAVFGQDGEWASRWPLNPEDGPDLLPAALRVRFESRRLGQFDIIERLR